MRRHRLGILAGVSAILFATLSLGYFMAYDLSLNQTSPPYRSISLWCHYGVAGCKYSRVMEESANDPNYSGHSVARKTIEGRYFTPSWQMSLIRDSLWDFDYRRGMDAMFNGAEGHPWVTVEFPIWCVLLPCSIAPVFWLRRRRLRARGFPVEPANAEPPPRSR